MYKNLIIMNSAMMPSEGIYKKENLNIEEVKELLDIYKNKIESFVGYQNVIDMMKEKFNLSLNLNRNTVTFSDKEVSVLTIQLNYRILSPEEKSLNLHGTKIEDYTFSLVKYYPLEDFAIYLQELKMK